MPSIDTLVPDIRKLFDEGATLTPDTLTKFSEAIKDNTADRFKEYGTERAPSLRLSNVGRPLRQLWFELRSGLEGEKLSSSAKFKFWYGDLIEDALIMLAIEAGHDVDNLQKEVEVLGVRGRIDCTIDGVLVDVKSASSRSFDKFANGSIKFDDPFGYIGQLAGYSRGLGGIDGAFLACDKTLGHITLLKIPKEELNNYNIEDRITAARLALDRDRPPSEYCYPDKEDGESGNRVLPIGCSYCSFKHACRPGLRTFIYSTGPKYFTVVNKLPRVPEVT